MGEIPHAVLSEHFQECMKGRRLRTAVFLTYQFDPGFFEQEVLPVLLDTPLSHAVPIRLLQLEDALRGLPGEIAVYYDANGLVAGDGGSARLDVRRIPIRHRTGIFHAKNVFLLVEDEDGDQQGYRAQTLLVASLSANLTRSGWWENVEACQVEEIAEDGRTRLKDDLESFLKGLQRRVSAEQQHLALREILAFLKRVTPRLQRSSGGQLHTHFYAGSEPLAGFLEQTAGGLLQGTYLEVISPYFDDAADCRPLEALIERFQPREVRVFLPRSAAGEGLCRPELYDSVSALPGVRWGRLPREISRLGRSDEAGDRFVHAKVYRFFTQSPKREICFVGSANLTSAAHQAGGNVETGFLVDLVPPRRPEFWLTVDERRPTEFQVTKEDDVAATAGGTPLNLRYHWNTAVAEAFWDAPGPSPALTLEARGITVGTLPALPSRAWSPLGEEIAKKIAEHLTETSLFFVLAAGQAPALLLIQEEGMAQKPSLLVHLSATDILRYWSLLSVEQRAAAIEAHTAELALDGQGADLVARFKTLLEGETLFDRFAGVFHAFGSLERSTRSALDADQEKEVGYRLFGKKYDSLGSLLDRVASDGGAGNDVDDYVLLLCARQLCREVGRDYPDYWSRNVAGVAAIEERFRSLGTIRQRLVESQAADFGDFLTWFDAWFLKRAVPVTEGT